MKNDELIRQLTDERLDLSRVLQILQEADIDDRDGNEQLAELYTQQAFMWLGKAKGALGEAFPYPTSMDPTVKTIEKAVDVYEGKFEGVPQDVDQISIVKYLRGELNNNCRRIRSAMGLMTDEILYQDCLFNSWTAAENAKMHLGMILGNFRRAQERRENTKALDGTVPPTTLFAIDVADAPLLEQIKDLALKEIGPKDGEKNLLVILNRLKEGREHPELGQINYILNMGHEVLPEGWGEVVTFDSPTGQAFLDQCYNYLMGQETWMSLKPQTDESKQRETGSVNP